MRSSAVKTEPKTGAWQRLANKVLVPVLVILIGALSLGLGIGLVKLFSAPTALSVPAVAQCRVRSASRCSRSRWRKEESQDKEVGEEEDKAA